MRHCKVIIVLGVLIASEARVSHATRELIATTGGRGHWSDAIHELADELEAEPGAAAASFDWGFHLQLLFLTRKPSLLD